MRKLTVSIVLSAALGIAQIPAPRMTATQAESARAGTPFRQLLAFLDAFNSGDRARLSAFRDMYYPTMNLDAQMTAREQSAGLLLLGLDKATDTRIQGYVLERDSAQFGLFAL